MKSILRITAILLVTLFATAASFAQSLKVSGKVTQKSDGEPIIGRDGACPGTNTATVTDIDGNFILEVPAGSRLQFTYLGMRTIETDAQSVMNVALEEDATFGGRSGGHRLYHSKEGRPHGLCGRCRHKDTRHDLRL